MDRRYIKQYTLIRGYRIILGLEAVIYQPVSVSTVLARGLCSFN